MGSISSLKQILNDLILQIDPSSPRFVLHPGKDFTRTRMLPFHSLLLSIISMGGNSIHKELFDSFDFQPDQIPSVSAFCQQRDKILPFAFEFLFHQFTHAVFPNKTYHGFRLLAADGTSFCFRSKQVNSVTLSQTSRSGIPTSMLHLNALYDLNSRFYSDCMIQPASKKSETGALSAMVDRSDFSSPVLLIADRGYESYNVFAHIEQKGWNYLIRVKDSSSNGILSSCPLPSKEEFDVPQFRILTDKHTNPIREQTRIFVRFSPNKPFDFFDSEHHFYLFFFRVVRLRIAKGRFETLVTNLAESEFPFEEIKRLYRLRWGVETSFRKLKYAIGAANFHSKKADCIEQELFARLIMYNLCEALISSVPVQKPGCKYPYQVHFTETVIWCRYLLRPWCRANPPDIEALIRRNVLPAREGRSARRKKKSHKPTHYLYRIA